jgi:transcriptional regulator GlxA family with amidase domain
MPVEIPGSVKSLDRRVAGAIAIMNHRRADPPSVDEVARAVNLSPSYLTRLFQRHVGCSPAQFDRAQRLDRAHELIIYSFLSIKQVMASVGWNDPSHFSRDFRRRFGVSPRALRAACAADRRAQRAAERRATDQHAHRPTNARIGQHSKGADRRRRG